MKPQSIGLTDSAYPDLALEWSSNNGSVPPPYRRSTEVVIDAKGRGRVSRLLGYDRTDAAQRYAIEFTTSAAVMHAVAAAMDSLGVFTTRWRERPEAPVGGSTTAVKISRGEITVRLPIHAIEAQCAAVAAIIAALRELIPAETQAFVTTWEAARGEPD